MSSICIADAPIDVTLFTVSLCPRRTLKRSQGDARDYFLRFSFCRAKPRIISRQYLSGPSVTDVNGDGNDVRYLYTRYSLS